jgi:DNA-binding response OmpR family regulator
MIQQSVLIVEDEEDIRELISYNLLKEGFQVASVALGEEALVAADARPPH